MKHLNKVALVLGAALLATPVYAGAAQEGGTVCGRVQAPTSVISQLEQAHDNLNVVIARSSSEEVQTTVNLDGTFCFSNLHNDLHTLTAWNDTNQFSKSVTPETGRTLYVELTGTAPQTGL